MEDVVKSALGIETEGYVHQLHFLYPRQGGIESLVRAFQKPRGRTVTGFQVRTIRRRGADWIVSDGRQERAYHKLVATAPVTDLLTFLEGVPAEVTAAAAGLRHNAVRVVMIGVNNESLMDKSAIYVPDAAVAPHRLCYMGFFSGANVPKGKSSLIAEITTHPGLELHGVSDAGLTQVVAEQLAKAGIIDPKDVVATDVTNCPFGYVVYDLAYARNIQIVRDYFARIGIELHGRFAQWDYINMDEVIRRSIRLADKLTKG
jgi:protoporphyrinogen oxidase